MANKLCENCKGAPARQLLTLAAAGLVNCADTEIGKMLHDCHIAQWRQASRFCGSCGAENGDISGASPHRVCPNCGREEYPRISPAMIVLITDSENRILLAHNKKFRTGMYSHISGFCEAGESIEETVAREVHEEVNIKISDIEYVKSQPWPFPNSLMIGFRARYVSGTIKPDGDEIEDAKWFTKDNLPEIPAEGSLSRLLINEWLASCALT